MPIKHLLIPLAAVLMLLRPAHLPARQPLPAKEFPQGREETVDTLQALLSRDKEDNPMALSNLLPGLKETYGFYIMSDSLMMDDSLRNQHLAVGPQPSLQKDGAARRHPLHVGIGGDYDSGLHPVPGGLLYDRGIAAHLLGIRAGAAVVELSLI